jgi:hypothetical protein
MKDIQKIKEFFSKPLKEERDIYDEIANEEFGMDYDQLGPNEKEWVRDEASNMDEAMTTAYESKSISDYKVGDIISFKDGEDWKVMKVKDNVDKLVIKPHNEKAKEGNVSLEIDIDADYLKKNILEAKEEYTVAGHSVTLNKGTKSDGTDWTVTFKNGKSKPLADVLSLIKPMPKGITMNEAKEEDSVDTITMDIPLFLRMLEYAREDAKQDLDLHDVTEKANKLGKERGILQMDDYEEIVGTSEEMDENLNEANVPSNIADFAKRKGVSSLVRKVAGWAEKVGARIAGGTAVGKNYSTLVLDLDYKQQGEIRINTDEETITLYDEPVNSFNDFQRVYADGADNNLEEGEEEQLSFISKARAKSSLRQFLSGKRDDGMGKFDAIVYGIDADGKKHQIKYYNDLQNYKTFALGDNPDFVKEGLRGEIDEPFFIEVSVRDAIKAFNIFKDQYNNSDIEMYGSNVYASDDVSDIYDLFYDLTNQDIEILDYNIEHEYYDYDSGYEDTLAETILRKLKNSFKN